MSKKELLEFTRHMSKKELLEFAQTAHEENVKLVQQYTDITKSQNSAVRRAYKAEQALAKANERVDGLEKALANCADALYESNINHKKAIDKIQAECIDVLFDFAAKRDDSGFAIALYEQPYEIQDAIRTFKQLRKEQE